MCKTFTQFFARYRYSLSIYGYIYIYLYRYKALSPFDLRSFVSSSSQTTGASEQKTRNQSCHFAHMIVSSLQLGIFYQWKLWANNAIAEAGAIPGTFLEAVAHQD